MNVVLDIKIPVVKYFENVFEEEDRWEQIVGCEACEEKGNCCGRCKMKLPSGDCRLHIEDCGQKPLGCIVTPDPTIRMSRCAVQFKSIKGSRRGEVIKVNGR